MNISVAPMTPLVRERIKIEMVRELLTYTVLKNPYISKMEGKFPSEKQAVFLTYPAEESLIGGAAGPGKSAALLAAALQYVMYPGYSAIILRKSFKQLESSGGLIEMSRQWLAGTNAQYDSQRYRWYFPTFWPKTKKAGLPATVSFGYLDSEADKYQYQGSAYQGVFPDELTQFSESKYTYMFSRLRRLEGFNVPLRMMSASNPGGEGNEWVKRRFVDGAVPIAPGAAVRINPASPRRIFIPAMLDDNPGLDKVAYRQQLEKLDFVTRRQLLYGDWNVRAEGNLFRREWFEIVPPDRIPPLVRRVRYWDLAASEPTARNPDPDWTVGTLMGMTDYKTYFVLNVQRFRKSPLQTRSIIQQTARMDGPAVSVFVEQEPGSAGKAMIDVYRREVLNGLDARGVRNTGDKVTRARPLSSLAEYGDVKLVEGAWLNDWLDEMVAFPQDGVHDDCPDSASGALAALNRGRAWETNDLATVFDPKPTGEDSTRRLLLSRLQGANSEN